MVACSGGPLTRLQCKARARVIRGKKEPENVEKTDDRPFQISMAPAGKPSPAFRAAGWLTDFRHHRGCAADGGRGCAADGGRGCAADGKWEMANGKEPRLGTWGQFDVVGTLAHGRE